MTSLPFRRLARVLLVGILICAIASPAVKGSHVTNHIVQSNWDLFYEVTPSDGPRIALGFFRTFPVIGSISIPQILVQYSFATYIDQLGSGGATGTPIPFRSFRKVNLGTPVSGFELQFTYQMNSWPVSCSYKYVVRYRFHDGGHFEPWVNVYGPGCDVSATYRVFLRVDLDVEGADGDGFWKHTGSMQLMEVEGNYPDDGSNDPSGFEWVHSNLPTGRGFYIQARPPDTANMFALQFHLGQGDMDLPNLTMPSTFDNDESIRDVDVEHWYESRRPFTRPSGCPPTCRIATVIGPQTYAAAGF